MNPSRRNFAIIAAVLLIVVAVFVSNAHRSSLATMDDLTHHGASKRIAIVMRTVMPLKKTTLKRMVLLSRAMATPKFRNYQFYVMSDETKMRGTEEAVRRYYQKMADVPMPLVYAISKTMVLDYFAPGLQRYAEGPLKNGEPGECCGIPLMWQLSVPPFVMFLTTHKHQYGWNFEEDVWAVGNGISPLADLFYEWDQQLEKTSNGVPVGFAASSTKANQCPFNFWLKNRHTESFHEILVKMQNSSDYETWKRRRNLPWYNFNERVTSWVCISDGIYRHSLDFSKYFKQKITNGTFRFGEGVQQPIAWSGKFLSKDLKKLLPPEKTPTGFDLLTLSNVQKKVLESEAVEFYLADDNNSTAGHLMHSREAEPQT